MTVIAETPWWYLFYEMAMIFSISLANFIDSWWWFYHHSLIRLSVAIKDYLVIVGKPRTDIVSCNVAWPPPVDNWPHTAVKLFSQYWYPLGSFTFADVAKIKSSLQHMVKTDANPSLFAHLLIWCHYRTCKLAMWLVMTSTCCWSW